MIELMGWIVTTAALGLSGMDAPTPHRHLVIAPERFRESLRAYCDHRTKASPHLESFEFVTLERALSLESGRDDAERLKRFLFTRWKEGRLTSCLLVGDCDTLPMRSMTLDRGTAPAFHWAFYPCDLYYGDVADANGSFDDWNGRTDGFHADYWGEVHGETNKDGVINADRVDYDPELAIGRWPVSTPEECAAVAAKTIAFERATSGKDATRPIAAFFAVGGWVDVRGRIAALGERMSGSHEVAVHLHDTPNGSPPNEESMKAVLARHPRFVFHTGHGQPWGYEGCLSLKTIKGIPPGPAQPIYFSVGCSTAEVMTQAPYQPYVDIFGTEHAGTNAGEVFTAPPPPPAVYQSGPRNTTSIAETLVRVADGGAVAAIGCDTGSQPCAVTLLDGFVETIAAKGELTLGDAWVEAIRHYRTAERLTELVPTADWYPPSIFFQGMKFVVLGDPALRLAAVPLSGP
ncbi:MAG: hypothetical protein JNL80_01090 [Phycisphaerae bacterium]|jgi:hypothetical protein|nr:hypothetical protein [Phycisphaerae bacterium]